MESPLKIKKKIKLSPKLTITSQNLQILSQTHKVYNTKFL